jgi:two-component system sensor histidine kinase YesM
MLDQFASGKMTIEGENDRFFVIKKKLDLANWNMVVFISNSGIQSQFKWVYIIGCVFGLGGLITTVIVFISLTRWIIRPLKQMVSLTKKVQRGNLNAQMEVHGKDEIAQLGMALNAMISHLNEVIHNEYQAQLTLRNTELNLRNAEYRSLQAQLQPHFLYNVLSGFIGLNRLGQKEMLEYSIISLSRLLRYVLNKTDQASLKDEFDFLVSYCNLQKMRFLKKGFDFSIACSPDAENLLFPKLLLQPLVENAIIHGIEPINRPCQLTVSACIQTYHDEEYLEIVVMDDGAGFEQKSNSESHIGLDNVQERLHLCYSHATFFIQSEIQVGTKAILRIPLEEMTQCV